MDIEKFKNSWCRLYYKYTLILFYKQRMRVPYNTQITGEILPHDQIFISIDRREFIIWTSTILSEASLGN